MRTLHRSRHTTEYDQVAGLLPTQHRKILGGYLNYRELDDVWKAADPKILSTIDSPNNWSGIWDGEYWVQDAPFQAMVGDSLDSANRTLVGVRLSDSPRDWLNLKVVDANAPTTIVSGDKRSASWGSTHPHISALSLDITRSKVILKFQFTKAGSVQLTLKRRSDRDFDSATMRLYDEDGGEAVRLRAGPFENPFEAPNNAKVTLLSVPDIGGLDTLELSSDAAGLVVLELRIGISEERFKVRKRNYVQAPIDRRTAVRTIQNDIHYTTRTDKRWKRTRIELQSQSIAPEEWVGRWDGEYWLQQAMTQVLIGDSTDPTNKCLFGVRRSDHPDGWGNLKIIGADVASTTINEDNRSASWLGALPNVDVTVTPGPHKLTTYFDLVAGHPDELALSTLLPRGHRVVPGTNGRLHFIDEDEASTVELRAWGQEGTNSLGAAVPVTIELGSDFTIGERTYPTIKLMPDTKGVTYPIRITLELRIGDAREESKQRELHYQDVYVDPKIGSRKRIYRSFTNFKLPGNSDYRRAIPELTRTSTKPPNWLGRFDMRRAGLNSALQTFAEDTTDTRNSALWGMRLSDEPDIWLNIKAVGVNPWRPAKWIDRKHVQWNYLWSGAHLHLSFGPGAIQKEIEITSLIGPGFFDFTIRRAPNTDLEFIDGGILLKKNGETKLQLKAPTGADANFNPIRVSLINLGVHPQNSDLHCIRILPNVDDMVLATLPARIDPTATLGDGAIEDTFLRAASKDFNYGGASWLELGQDHPANSGHPIFRLTDPTNDIPPFNIREVRIKLYAYANGSGNQNGAFHKLLDVNADYVNGTATNAEQIGSCCWNDAIFENIEEWAGGPGCDNGGVDYVSDPSPPVMLFAASEAPVWKTTTLINSWFEDWRDGVGLNGGFKLRPLFSNPPNSYVYFRSLDYGDSDFHPVIEIEYKNEVTIEGTSAIEDTYLISGSPNTNYGNSVVSPRLGKASGSIFRGLVRITDAADIPEGDITAVKYVVWRHSHTDSAGSNNVDVYAVSAANTWAEGSGGGTGCTWANLEQSPGALWAGHPTLGCGLSGTDHDVSLSATLPYDAYTVGDEVEVEVVFTNLSIFEEFRDGGRVNNGFLFRARDEATNNRFWSVRSTEHTDPTLTPKWIITFNTTILQGTAAIEDNSLLNHSTHQYKNYGTSVAAHVGDLDVATPYHWIARLNTGLLPFGDIEGFRLIRTRLPHGASQNPGVQRIGRIVPANDWVEGTSNGVPEEGASCARNKAYHVAGDTEQWVGGIRSACSAPTDYNQFVDTPYSAFTSGPNYESLINLPTVWVTDWRDLIVVNNGVVCFDETETDYALMIFYSSNYTTDPALQPVFEIDFTPPVGNAPYSVILSGRGRR